MHDTCWVSHSCHEFLEFDTFNTGSVDLYWYHVCFLHRCCPDRIYAYGIIRHEGILFVHNLHNRSYVLLHNAFQLLTSLPPT